MSGPDEVEAQIERAASGIGPPALHSFGLTLHHDGSWTHQGVAFRNRKLREKFDRSVRYLPEESAFVVQIGRFRGMVDVEEAGFFVRLFDPQGGTILLSDDSEESLDVACLESSERDGALLCRVKRELVAEGLLARFSHAAQAEFMNAVVDAGDAISMAGRVIALPPL